MNVLVRWVREHRKEAILGIVVSLVCSLLLSVCVNPILGLVQRAFYWIGTTFLVSLLDSIAREAAKGDPPVGVPLLAFSYMAMLCVAAVLLTVLRIMFEAIGYFDFQAEKWKASVAAPPENTTDPSETPNLLKPFPLQAARRFWWIVVVMTLAWAGYVFLNFVSTLMTVTIRQQFHQRMAILAPHLSEEEEERFFADFASMNEIMDYEALTKQLKTIADEKDVPWP